MNKLFIFVVLCIQIAFAAKKLGRQFFLDVKPLLFIEMSGVTFDVRKS